MLIDDGLISRFGAALAWADRAGVSSLDVLVDEGPVPGAAGVVARRAACFCPAPAVYAVSGRSLSLASPSAAVLDSGEPPAWAVDVLQAHGLEIVWEHGVLRGEVLGLEVARMVGDELEVGVGRHDRYARYAMRPGQSLDSALSEAAAAVRALRTSDAPAHPANTLARSRWLRALLCASPARFGFASLQPVAPPLPWFDLPSAGPAPCVGTSEDGSAVVLICSVGVDLDLVPTAADCRVMYGANGRPALWLVVPAGDDVAVNRSLAERLDPPAQFLVVPRDWPALASG